MAERQTCNLCEKETEREVKAAMMGRDEKGKVKMERGRR